ncbi:MAG: hypothetical protein LUC99_05870 [Clostridiales bacterium]|nr:hypothetical protein [Clostridiales bacterium]
MFEKQTEKARWRSFGIIGAGRAVGVTHLAIWLANYQSGVCRKRTALLEWNRHGDFARLAEFCVKKGAVAKRFSLLEVDYYGVADAAVLADCLTGDYRSIIIDYGEATEGNIAECARCDRGLIVGSLSEWQAERFWELLGCGVRRNKSWSYAVAFGSEEARKALEKEARIHVLRIPSSADAFAVSRADMYFFEKLCGE